MTRKLLRAIPWSIGVAVLASGVQPMAQSARDAGPAAVGTASATPAPATTGHPPLVVLTSADDRQRVMDQLKISAFPSTPMPYQAATYDESKADPYPDLPDPLLFNNGTKSDARGCSGRRGARRSSSSSIARSTAVVPR